MSDRPIKREAEAEAEEEEEEDFDEMDYKAQKDAVLFAIDVSRTMVSPLLSDSKKGDADSSTLTALKCAYQIMQQRIISNPRDMMGVLLFGTQDTKFQEDIASNRGGLAYPHCYLLADLDIPAVEDVKVLREIVEDEDEANKLLIPSDEPVAMSNLLFCANQIFTTKAPSFGSRRLFIITDNDNPHGDDKNAKSQAAVRAKDLYDLGVVIELFPISRPDNEFDRAKFYDDIIYRDPNEGEDLALHPTNFKSAGASGVSLLNNLISDINSKQVAKRALFSNLPFEIGPGFKISVKGYNILQKQAPARSMFIYLDGEKAQIAAGETTKMAEDTAQTVDKVEIKKAYKFGGDTVFFTPEEQKELRNFGPPVLRIIGFKPQSMLPDWASVHKSTFVYPSEEDYVGSTRVFAALWQKLLKDKIMGVAWYVARRNASPLLVAILPSNERVDDLTGGQLIPQGLWLYPLPFADDVRPIPECPKLLVAPDKLVDEMRKIVQQLQLPNAIYDPEKYPNPSLQWHYKILQAIALEEELPDAPEDKTIPKYRQINKRAGGYIASWGDILDKYSQAHESERRATSVKRERDDEEEMPKKKAKSTRSVQGLKGMSTDDLRAAVDRGSLNKFTVADLKDWLHSKGISSSGKKAELIERVEEWVENA